MDASGPRRSPMGPTDVLGKASTGEQVSPNHD